MRMSHYWLVGALIFVPALAYALFCGVTFDGTERHLWAGLFAACLGVGVHTLTILFMLVTGRVLREAMRARPLGPEFLAELNQFFARKRAYPAAALAAFALVATGVLGFSQRGFGISPAWHMLVGIASLLLNLWALQQEYLALRANQVLVDRVAGALDALDREQPPDLAALEAQANDPHSRAAKALAFAAGVWFPYLYWVFVVWRGDFTRVSIHPWLELSLLGLLLAALARRDARRPASK